MFSRAGIGIPLILVSSFLGLTVPGARADEAYLCGPDTVVYVKIEELEHKKKTDKCIAAYFGLTVAEDAAGQESMPITPAKNTPAKANTRPDVELKSLTEPEHELRAPAKFERSALLVPPSAAPGTDYRNIRVINAGSSESQWFKHHR